MRVLLICFFFFFISAELRAQESLLKQGQQYLEIGRNDLALETLQKAENNLQNSEDLEAAQCYNSLGIVYYNNGNLETSQNYLEKGLAIRKSLLDDSDPILADSYINMGLLFLEEDFLNAVIYFDQALEIYREVYGKSHPKVAFCYTNLAFAHRYEGNYQEALAYLDLTLKIWETLEDGDHPNKALTLSNKAVIYEQQGAYEQSLELQSSALDMYLSLYGKRHPEVANAYALIGSVHSNMKNYNKAVVNFQKSIYANLYDQDYTTIYDQPEIRDYYNAQYLLSSLRAKAQAMEAYHFNKSLKPRDIQGALTTYQKCDELIKQIRQSRLSEKDKIRIGNIASEVYDNGIRIALYLSERTFQKAKYREIAFDFCERNKSSTLLEAINEARAKSYVGIPADLIKLEDSLKAEISWLEKEVAKRGNDSDQKKSRLFTYKQAYRDFIEQLEKNYPAYFNLKYAERKITVTQIQNLLPPSTALLSYFVGEGSIYLFQITRSGFDVFDFEKDEFFNRWISGLRNSIKYDVPVGFDQSAWQLHKQLIPDIDDAITQLIILPDGMLGTVPFETLLVEQPGLTDYHYLIEDYAISYDFASSLVVDKLKARESGSSASGIFLSAPVTFDTEEFRMPPLPGSEEEVEQIKYLFQSESNAPTVCINEEASESRLKTGNISDYRYLHFATHGIVNEARPELSRIFLAPDEQEDGSLYSGEIYNLDINADLVTLSACETGLGKIEKGEGIIGLSRSLTYAGARNLIVSLWQVADESTALLMIDFYREHLVHSENDFFSDDLRAAKLKFITEKEAYTKPYYWAPFILIGL